MKKTTLLALLAFFTLSLHSQNMVFVKDSIMNAYMKSGFANKNFWPKGDTDKMGKRQGKWKDYKVERDHEFISGNGEQKVVAGYFLLYGEGKYINGRRDGNWEIYVLEDKSFKKILQKRVFYKDGILMGGYTYYYMNGKTAQKGNFENDFVQGTVKTYYEDGSTCNVIHHLNGKRNGIDTGYYANGNIRFVAGFTLDSADGNYVAYYPNQKLQETFTSKNGAMEGAYRYYYSNGQLWVERIYKDGLLMNITCSNAPDGSTRDKGTLKDGNGTLNYYTEDGKLYTTDTYKDGKKVKSDAFGVFK